MSDLAGSKYEFRDGVAWWITEDRAIRVGKTVGLIYDEVDLAFLGHGSYYRASKHYHKLYENYRQSHDPFIRRMSRDYALRTIEVEGQTEVDGLNAILATALSQRYILNATCQQVDESEDDVLQLATKPKRFRGQIVSF